MASSAVGLPVVIHPAVEVEVGFEAVEEPCSARSSLFEL